MVEAKNRVNRALFKLRQYVSDVSVDSQYS